jgi:hypothetical protein
LQILIERVAWRCIGLSPPWTGATPHTDLESIIEVPNRGIRPFFCPQNRFPQDKYSQKPQKCVFYGFAAQSTGLRRQTWLKARGGNL